MAIRCSRRESVGRPPLAQCGLCPGQSCCCVDSAAVPDAGSLLAEKCAFEMIVLL